MIGPSSASWSIDDATELYDVARWGQGYFSVAPNGHLLVHPGRDPRQSVDLKELIDLLHLRGLDVPILLRFNGIIQDRLRVLRDAFAIAIEEHSYTGGYRCVYPVKVNQQREVVEKIVEYGRQFGFGLEAGSKPELLAVVAMTTAETPIVCNGFKDAEFIEMALLAQKIGRSVIPIVEKFTELPLILRIAEKLEVRPKIGMRVKLTSRGAGRWQSSGGYQSKFGLRTHELLDALDLLKQTDMADCFTLLHFHLGSQITNIRQVKAALTEAARIYCDLVGRGAGLDTLDIGGGLGVDYDGSQTNFESSMNYSLDEYARDVVYHIQSVCNNTGVKHPNIISESGRAVSAYHSALVFGVLGVSDLNSLTPAGLKNHGTEVEPQPIRDLRITLNDLNERNTLESYHDAQQAIDTAMTLFVTGHLALDQRGLAEDLYFTICQRIRDITAGMDYIPEELQKLDRLLADNYFCNFSLFQSMPDHWAIKQLFPVMPIHRLDQRPSRQAVLSDITCDSDGKIDRFIDRRDVRATLPVHSFDGSPYYLGAFLVGAYQEILGDLHNLFGDTNAVHIEVDDDGKLVLHTLIKGETVREVLDYVQFRGTDLIRNLQSSVEKAVQEGLIDHKQGGYFVRFYEDALNGYTYMEDSQP